MEKKGLISSQPALASFLRGEDWDVLTLANYCRRLSMLADRNKTRKIQKSVINTL